MIKEENFPKAYKEVYTILQYVSEDDFNCIPDDFIQLLKENMDTNYMFEYNPKLDFAHQTLLRETKAICSYIYLHYWADEQEQKIIREQYRKDIIEAEAKKKEQFQETDMFKARKKTVSANTQLIERQQESILKRIVKQIKQWLYRQQ